jgi:predicted CopG family antitoxin
MTLEEERSFSEFIKELKETQQNKIKILKKSKKTG